MQRNILLLLHLYQPPYQDVAVVNKVADECYSKLLKWIKSGKNSIIYLNINASLTEQLICLNRYDVIDDLKQLANDNVIRFTESAAYHPILPLIDIGEAKRQIEINHNINAQCFGDCYNPSGFFFPELCFSKELISLVESLGYSWVLIDGISYSGKVDQFPMDTVFNCNSLKVFFRHRTLSNQLARSIWRKFNIDTVDDLIVSFDKLLPNKNNFAFVALDGEVFGHHVHQRGKLLRNIVDDSRLKLITIEQAESKYCPSTKEVNLIASSWSTQENDLYSGSPFPLWYQKSNKIHLLQKELINLTCEANSFIIDTNKPSNIDRALASDQQFWASCQPWWNGIMVEKGTNFLVQAIEAYNRIPNRVKESVAVISSLILGEVQKWNSSGKAKKIQSNFITENNLKAMINGSTLL